MKKILILLDGIVAKTLLKRIIEDDISQNHYDIIYTNDSVIDIQKPNYCTFYKFDPTSLSKLKLMMLKANYEDILVVLANKLDTSATIENIRHINKTVHINVFNEWNLEFNDENIYNYNALNILANGLIETLPNVPVVAQNVGLRQGEIMEIRIPFGSSYVYRYLGSIAQKDWKIVTLYRNNKMINAKSTLVLKPNDTILAVGKPKVLLQVFNAISKSQGHFPMPFGRDIYLYIDMYLQSESDAMNSLKKAIYTHERLNSKELMIKITRPSTMHTIDLIKRTIKGKSNIHIEFDYGNTGIESLLKNDTKRFDIGLFIISPTLLRKKYIVDKLLKYNKPILKIGTENMRSLKEISILLNDEENYTQIAPIVFDIASQFLYTIHIINADPIGNINRTKVIEHFENLAKIFNQKMKMQTSIYNPIKELEKLKNTLQILPLKAEMFQKRKWSFFSTNSDIVSYDIDTKSQILVPIIE